MKHKWPPRRPAAHADRCNSLAGPSKKPFYVYFRILHAYTIIYLKYRVFCCSVGENWIVVCMSAVGVSLSACEDRGGRYM